MLRDNILSPTKETTANNCLSCWARNVRLLSLNLNLAVEFLLVDLTYPSKKMHFIPSTLQLWQFQMAIEKMIHHFRRGPKKSCPRHKGELKVCAVLQRCEIQSHSDFSFRMLHPSFDTLYSFKHDHNLSHTRLPVWKLWIRRKMKTWHQRKVYNLRIYLNLPLRTIDRSQV